MSTKTTELVETLKYEGWSLAFTTIDVGAYDRESKYGVTLSRGGSSLSVEYSKGAGHRRWKSKRPFLRSINDDAMWWDQFKAKVGEHVRWMGKPPKQALDFLNRNTEPVEPTLDEVVYSMLMDTMGVRDGQTFDDWASEFGLDTDSRKAEQMFNDCREEWAGMVRLGADFDLLESLFEDY